MRGLSSSIGHLRPHYDAVVVGSGYGAAVAAFRLTSACKPDGDGQTRPVSVCVLERGREFHAGEFPVTLRGALARTQIDFGQFRVGSRQGLFDLRVNRDVSVLVGCGLGGTSLINANVALKPTGRVLASEAWPRALREETDTRVEAAYRRALHVLDAQVLPAALVPRKHLALAAAAAATPVQAGSAAPARGRKAAERVPLTVAFRASVDALGVQHQPCRMCGDCITGCNHGAKRTLARSYLPHAVASGARIFCGVRVLWLERLEQCWRIHFDLTDQPSGGFRLGGMFITADAVFLGAGTLGSTEILLRSRERGLSLSERLGQGFSGNGDAIAFGYNLDSPVLGVGFGSRLPGDAEPVGPTITTMIDERDHTPPLLIQEGAIPGVLAGPVRFFAPLVVSLGGIGADNAFRDRMREWGRELVTILLGSRAGAMRRTQTYLVMTEEENSGVLERRNGALRVQWKGVGHQAVFRAVARRLGTLTRALRGTHVVNPISTRLFGRRLITVHPLGGCCMGEDVTTGVVDHAGRVFRGDGVVHDGLYVCDGAVMPRALGTNPLLTITAMAERITSLAVRERRGRGWHRPIPTTREQPMPLPKAPAMGFRFSERMSGFFDAGVAAGSRLEVALSMTCDDLDRLVTHETHECEVVGVARAPALSAAPLTIAGGVFNLFTAETDRVEMRVMRYHLPMRSIEGGVYELRGEKVLTGATPLRQTWRRLSRIHLDLRAGGQPAGSAHLRVAAVDLPRMILGGRTLGRYSLRAHLLGRLRFVRYFLGAVVEASFWPVRRADPIDPHRKRPGTGSRPAVRPEKPDGDFMIPVQDGAIRLRWYQGDRAAGEPYRPVILAPGFGMSTDAFVVGTIEENITEYLERHGYDVWLLDYRASERTGFARTQFTIDDLVRHDFPKAVDIVLEVMRERRRPAECVDFIGHCVGSLSLLLSLGSGLLPRVRSAICSQVYFFLSPPPWNRLKSALHLATLLRGSGFSPVMAPDYDVFAPLSARFMDRLLCFLPTRERCRNPVCRQILFMYGEVLLHRHLNDATHAHMYNLFNAANLTALEQMSAMIRAKHAVSANRTERYLDSSRGRHFDLPVTLMQGSDNNIFRPPAAQRTLDWLLSYGAYARDRALAEQAYRILPIDRYGHLDCFIGRNARRDVFPKILAALRHGEKFAGEHPRAQV